MRTVFVILFVVFIGFGFLLSDNLHVRQDFISVKEQNSRLLQDLRTVQAQATLLGNENLQLKERIGHLDASNAALQTEVHNIQKENSILRDQNSQLQNEIDYMTATSSWLSKLALAISSPISLAVFIPFVPLSLGATYAWLRFHKRSGTHHHRDGSTNSQRTVSVQLTQTEWRELIKMRRNRQFDTQVSGQ